MSGTRRRPRPSDLMEATAYDKMRAEVWGYRAYFTLAIMSVLLFVADLSVARVALVATFTYLAWDQRGRMRRAIDQYEWVMAYVANLRPVPTGQERARGNPRA